MAGPPSEPLLEGLHPLGSHTVAVLRHWKVCSELHGAGTSPALRSPLCRHMVRAHWINECVTICAMPTFGPDNHADADSLMPGLRLPSRDDPTGQSPAHSRACPTAKGASPDTIGPSGTVTALQPGPQVEPGWPGPGGSRVWPEGSPDERWRLDFLEEVMSELLEI